MKRDRQFWAEHVAAIEREGIAVNAYAKRESISLAAIYYWKAKLRVPAAEVCGAAQPAVAFVQLRVADSVGARMPTDCTLMLASGVRLEMAGLPEPEWLARLVRATREGF